MFSVTYSVVKMGQSVENFSSTSRLQYTDKNKNKIFLIYEEIYNGAVAKLYMTNGLLIYGEIFSHFLIH
jgi:hypothetical protein